MTCAHEEYPCYLKSVMYEIIRESCLQWGAINVDIIDHLNRFELYRRIIEKLTTLTHNRASFFLKQVHNITFILLKNALSVDQKS